MDMVRFGILGAGTRAKELQPHFSRPEHGLHITAVADSWAEAFDQLRLATNIRTFADCQSLYASPDIDVVVITTPDFMHEEHACAALDAGKHVYIEKPMAITPEGCDRIMEAARRNGRVAYVGHNMRHFAAVRKMKELIEAGAVGEVRAITYRHAVSYGRWAFFREDRWQQKRTNVGSLLVHKGSHDLDIIHWFGGGRPKRVVAMGELAVWGNEPGKPDVEDVSSVLIRLSNGVEATYHQCHFAFRSSRECVVYGTEGQLEGELDVFTDMSVRLYQKRGRHLLGELPGEWHFERETFHTQADRRTVDEFVGVLRGTTATISIEDAAWAVKAGCAATMSLREGNRAIDIP